MELLIVEKNGWSKPVHIDQAITHIGSAPSNAIQLQSVNIAPVHIQILYSSNLASSCKVVNLAHQVIVKVGYETRQLPTYAAVDIRDGDEILLGDHSIKFRLPLSADVMQSAKMIHATLSFTDAVLKPEFVTMGVLTIKNAGEHSACQFQVELNGLPTDCFQIDPIPLMYAGAQEEVCMRIFHKLSYPLAGLQTIILKITAPESYPGEELILRQGIYVAPVFKQTLELVDDLSAAQKLQEHVDVSKESVRTQQSVSSDVNGSAVIIQSKPDEYGDSELAPAAIPAAESLEASSLQPSVQKELHTQAVQKQNVPAASRPVPDLSKLKVIRGSADADNFWDDK